MPRIRSIKPEFWEDERVGALSIGARLLFLGLISLADDAGRLRANLTLIKAQVFPYDSKVDVAGWMAELHAAGRIDRYSVDGEHFAYVINFAKHQKVDRPSPSKLAAPEDQRATREDSTSHRRALARRGDVGREASPTDQEGIGLDQEGSGSLSSVPAEARARVDWFVDLWNSKALPEFGRVAKLTDTRRKKADELLRQLSDEHVEQALVNLNAWPWRGKDGTWKPSFDYLLQDENLIKFAEGAKGGPPKLGGDVRRGLQRSEDQGWETYEAAK